MTAQSIVFSQVNKYVQVKPFKVLGVGFEVAVNTSLRNGRRFQPACGSMCNLQQQQQQLCNKLCNLQQNDCLKRLEVITI